MKLFVNFWLFWIGLFLSLKLIVTYSFSSEKVDLIVTLLNELSRHGLTISKNMAQLLEKKLESCSDSTTELLDQLSSGKLTPISRKKTSNAPHKAFSDFVKEERIDEALQYYEVMVRLIQL